MGGVVFHLQRLIDSLYLMSHPTIGDLAQKEDRIRFGANPQLCLSVNQTNVVLDTCTGPNTAGWTFNRSTGHIMNNGACLSSRPYPPTGTFMAECAASNVENEAQVWSWDPVTGLIKNQVGAVLTVTDTAPAVHSSVVSKPENAWRYRQQVWRSDGKTTCVGALCPKIGPAAWNQGGVTTIVDGISNVITRYPIDFNVFAYSKYGDFYHVEYPIAAAGDCSASGFNIDRGGNHQGAAVVAGGNVDPRFQLSNGTIEGFIYLPWWATLSSVTVPNTSRNGQPPEVQGYTGPITTEKPINFEMAFVDLDAWSQSLAGKSSTTARTGWTGGGYSSTFVLSSPGASATQKLEVYNLWDYQVAQIKNLQIATSVPTILINVKQSDSRSSTVNIGNMEITGYAGKNILWNFPSATFMKIQSMAFRGSVLAPRAMLLPNYGSLQGTMVAWEIIGGIECYGKTLSTYQDIK